MFEFAVIGPFAASRLGIVRQCIDCRAAAGLDAPACAGFGPGCLVTPNRDRLCYPPEPKSAATAGASIPIK